MVSSSQRAYSVTYQNYHDNIDTYYDVKIISNQNLTLSAHDTTHKYDVKNIIASQCVSFRRQC